MSNNCGICYKDLENTNIVNFHCDHKFHFTCILTLYNMNKNYSTKCPYCRQSFYKEIQYDSSDEITDDDTSEDSIPELINEDDIIEYNRIRFRPIPPPAPRSSRRTTPLSEEEEEEVKEGLWDKLKEIYKNYQIFFIVIFLYTLFLIGDIFLPKDILEIFSQHFKYMILTFLFTFVLYIIKTYKTFEENCRLILFEN